MDSKPIGSKLKEARINANITVKEISDILTMRGFKASPSTIYSWENDNSQPTPDAFLCMCKHYGISNPITFFEYNTKNTFTDTAALAAQPPHYANLDAPYRTAVDAVSDAMYKAQEQAKNQATATSMPDNVIDISTRRVALYEIRPSAGHGNLLDESPYTIVEIGPDAPIETSYCLTVSGDSMEPKLHDGELLYVRQQDYVEDGEIGIFVYDENVYVKRLEHRSGHTYLISLNSAYDPIKVNEYFEFCCLGKVLN